ncbi:uncharacterized protein LOC131893071 [Tigriopus californicus]|nr:uncharacterized protein LOC131893071 [Tigriopus californicus]
MVVKSNSAPSSPSTPESADPLRGIPRDGKVHKNKETNVEFGRLKDLVPAISRKQHVSKLDVILEAIRYIDQLQDQLLDQIQDNKISISAAAFLTDKENKNAPLLQSLKRDCQPRKRNKSG